MPLKRVLENLDGLEENIAALYIERNGKFFLDAEDEPEVSALRRAKEREATAAKELREQLAAAKAEIDEIRAQMEDGKPNKRKQSDIDAIEASWKAKLEKAQNDAKVEREALQASVSKAMIDAAATELASIFLVPSVGAKLIRERLSVDFGEEGPSLRVLDAAGSPSAMTKDDLRKEFLDNKEFAPILIATRATGGGANGAAAGNGGAGTKAFKDMTGAERAELYRTDRARFDREAAALKG